MIRLLAQIGFCCYFASPSFYRDFHSKSRWLSISVSLTQPSAWLFSKVSNIFTVMSSSLCKVNLNLSLGWSFLCLVLGWKEENLKKKSKIGSSEIKSDWRRSICRKSLVVMACRSPTAKLLPDHGSGRRRRVNFFSFHMFFIGYMTLFIQFN